VNAPDRPLTFLSVVGITVGVLLIAAIISFASNPIAGP